MTNPTRRDVLKIGAASVLALLPVLPAIAEAAPVVPSPLPPPPTNDLETQAARWAVGQLNGDLGAAWLDGSTPARFVGYEKYWLSIERDFNVFSATWAAKIRAAEGGHVTIPFNNLRSPYTQATFEKQSVSGYGAIVITITEGSRRLGYALLLTSMPPGGIHWVAEGKAV